MRTTVRKRTFALCREDGQALVELALVVPLLLFLLFAIVDFGEALNQYNDTTNLANLGARAAIVATTGWTPPTCGTSTSLVGYLSCEGALDSNQLANPTVCVTDLTSAGTFANGDTIEVTVAATFNWLKIMVGGIGKLGGVEPSLTSTIASSATMREEANNTSAPSWVTTGAQTTQTPC